MADKRQDRRWMRRGAKAWFYNGAWNASGVEPVTLREKHSDGLWVVVRGSNLCTISVADLYPTKADALLGLRDQMRRHCDSVEKRIAEIEEAIEQSKREANDG